MLPLKDVVGRFNERFILSLASCEGWLLSGGEDRAVRVWDAAAGRCEAVLEGPSPGGDDGSSGDFAMCLLFT
jgi:hypothetical protein